MSSFNCKQCGVTFQDKLCKKRQFCGRQCAGASRIGRHREDTKVTILNCKGCNTLFERLTCNIRPQSKSHYCSSKCVKSSVLKECLECGKEILAKKGGVERKKYCSRHCLGLNTPLAKGEIERNTLVWNKGKQLHYDVWNKGLKGYHAGNENGNWKGGITPLLSQIRTCTEYKAWRMAIFQRDKFACVDCGRFRKKGDRVILHADHIKPLSTLVRENEINSLIEALSCAELWDMNNGRTLCRECHKQTATYGVNFIRWNKEYLAESGTTDELNVTLEYTVD